MDQMTFPGVVSRGGEGPSVKDRREEKGEGEEPSLWCGDTALGLEPNAAAGGVWEVGLASSPFKRLKPGQGSRNLFNRKC